MIAKRATKQHEGVCPFSSIIRDQNAKEKSPGIKRGSLLSIKFDGFSSAKLYQQRISRLYVVRKKDYNFLEKSDLLKFILPMFPVGNEEFAEIRAGPCSTACACYVAGYPEAKRQNRLQQERERQTT